jgi:hypothetical protein
MTLLALEWRDVGLNKTPLSIKRLLERITGHVQDDDQPLKFSSWNR